MSKNYIVTDKFDAEWLQTLTGIEPAINPDGSKMTFEEFVAREDAKKVVANDK